MDDTKKIINFFPAFDQLAVPGITWNYDPLMYGIPKMITEEAKLINCECGQSKIATNKDDNNPIFHSTFCPIYKNLK